MADKTIHTDHKNLLELYGINNEKIDFFVSHFPNLRVIVRGQEIRLRGEPIDISYFEERFDRYLKECEKRSSLNLNEISELLNDNGSNLSQEDNIIVHGNNGWVVRARSEGQKQMVNAIKENDMMFAIGPAGTGKTFLAIACAVSALEQGHVDRIILARPAVEAGENLGFLPGDLSQKVDPYLRPLFDALYELLGTIKANRLIESKIIEIAPLAYMRGRTLNDAFVIMDEGQNTTIKQMKMFLTRLGFNSKAVITGDITQVDLPNGKPSGLIHCIDVLEGVDDIGFNYFNTGDVVRHPLVQKIVDAYDKDEAESRHDHR